MVSGLFGLASAVFVAAALTFTSGLFAASFMTSNQRRTTQGNDDRHAYDSRNTIVKAFESG